MVWSWLHICSLLFWVLISGGLGLLLFSGFAGGLVLRVGVWCLFWFGLLGFDCVILCWMGYVARWGVCCGVLRLALRFCCLGVWLGCSCCGLGVLVCALLVLGVMFVNLAVCFDVCGLLVFASRLLLLVLGLLSGVAGLASLVVVFVDFWCRCGLLVFVHGMELRV